VIANPSFKVAVLCKGEHFKTVHLSMQPLTRGPSAIAELLVKVFKFNFEHFFTGATEVCPV